MNPWIKPGSYLFKLFSGELLVDCVGNSGLVIFLRSVWVSAFLFSLALLVKSWCEAGPNSEFSWSIARQLVAKHFEWFGALFAGCYAAFYARYSSQWSYLADVYNQIMATKCTIPPEEHATNRSLLHWQVGFIEDAHLLHLDGKPPFAGVIKDLLKYPHVYAEFAATLPDTRKTIERRVDFDLERDLRKEYLAPAVAPSTDTQQLAANG